MSRPVVTRHPFLIYTCNFDGYWVHDWEFETAQRLIQGKQAMECLQEANIHLAVLYFTSRMCHGYNWSYLGSICHLQDQVTFYGDAVLANSHGIYIFTLLRFTRTYICINVSSF